MGGCRSIWGHRFVARYSTEPPNIDGISYNAPQSPVALIDALTKRTYKGDVCVRCGVHAPPAPEEKTG